MEFIARSWLNTNYMYSVQVAMIRDECFYLHVIYNYVKFWWWCGPPFSVAKFKIRKHTVLGLSSSCMYMLLELERKIDNSLLQYVFQLSGLIVQPTEIGSLRSGSLDWITLVDWNAIIFMYFKLLVLLGLLYWPYQHMIPLCLGPVYL